MKKEVVSIRGIKRSDLPFSHVVRAGNTLYLTSQLSCDLRTGEAIPGDVATQTRNALENVKFLLQEAGSSMENVVKVVIYLRHASHFDEMNGVYKEYFEAGFEPARVTVVAASPIDGIDIELEVTAVAG